MNAHLRAGERRSLVADLHDALAHHLSTASLHLMVGEENQDAPTLRRVLTTVQRANAAALRELRLLVRVLHDDPATGVTGTEVRELAERESPTQAAAEAERTLTRLGFEPHVGVPAAADALDLTVQRTLARAIRVVADNQTQYAPAGARCLIDVQVSDHQATLQARNPLAEGVPVHVQLGWGLKGLRERVDLTGGSLSAGPVGEEWVVTVVLPHE